MNSGVATLYSVERVLCKVEGYALLEKDQNGDFQMLLEYDHVKAIEVPISMHGSVVWAELKDGSRVPAKCMTQSARQVIDKYIQDMQLVLDLDA